MSLSKCQEVESRKKLKVALLDIENESIRVKSKIEAGQTSKSILDIPHLVWSDVKKQLQGTKFALYNACLSSPDIEQAVNGGSTRKKLRMLGEKVVTVLMKNYYFNADDLVNFLNTTNRDLQMFAGTNWWWFDERNSCLKMKCVTFKNSNDISLFYKKASEISNKWLRFRRHAFTFDSTKITTVMEYALFWEAAVSFLEKFGTFIMCINVKFIDKFPNNVPLQNCSDLLRIIPNIRGFRFQNVARGYEKNTILAYINNRTAEPYLSIEGDFVPLQETRWFESLQQTCVGWYMDSWEFENVKLPDPGFWDSSKELVVNVEYPDNQTEPYTELLCADFLNLQNVKKLAFRTGWCSWRSLAFLEKFPNAADVSLSIEGLEFGMSDDEIDNMNLPEICFPKVTKLTIATFISDVPTLDIIPTVLPSLRRLRLKLWCLEDRMKETHEEGTFDEHHIDVCRLIAENRSLKESNIWNEMGNLKEFRLQGNILVSGDVKRMTGNTWPEYYIGRSEIYTRMKDGSIGFQNIVTFN